MEQTLGDTKDFPQSAYLFADESGTTPVSVWTPQNQHQRPRQAHKFPSDAVIHSFRHTFGARLGKTAADAITIMKAIGHARVVVSQKYFHPTPETMDWAFDHLNAANEKSLASLPGAMAVEPTYLPATISATVLESVQPELNKAL